MRQKNNKTNRKQKIDDKSKERNITVTHTITGVTMKKTGTKTSIDLRRTAKTIFILLKRDIYLGQK